MIPNLDLPPIIGHRGSADLAPENTLAGIRRAHEEGAGWVEFDVKLTADGVPILMHDDSLGRTTDGKGKVALKTLEEIQTLDAGSWFAPEFAGSACRPSVRHWNSASNSASGSTSSSSPARDGRWKRPKSPSGRLPMPGPAI